MALGYTRLPASSRVEGKRPENYLRFVDLARTGAPSLPDLGSATTCCDMTTSPDGEPVPVERRLAEIHDRYGSGDLVSRSIQRATPMILRAVEQVHQRAAQTT